MGDEDRALDVLQEVWLKAFRTIHRLEKPSLVRTWLYQLTRGLAIDRWRKDAADDERVQVHAEQWSEVDDDPSFDQEDAARVHRALDKLDVKYREVLVLHFLEEMPIAQIAAVVGCPVGTVKSRLHYAKRALKAVLGGERHGNET
jgi:RNA polymerase sigma-70 factor (ECF subfamily)